MNYKIYQNSKEVSDKQAMRLLQDEAIGVFETMRAYNGKAFSLDEHLDRLMDSARTVGYQPLPDLAKLTRDINAALRLSGEKNTSIRLTLYAGMAFAIIGSREIPKTLYEKGVVLKTASFTRVDSSAHPYQAKASAYQQGVLASSEPNPQKAFDWLFLDSQHYLTESRVANFFIIKNKTLLTPPEHLILNGVTRRFVIKCAHELGLKVRETPLTRHDFFNADEAFLSNSSWEILPARELDGRVIGKKIPGQITAKLHRYFKRRIQESCRNK